MDPTTARYIARSIHNDRAAEAARDRRVKSLHEDPSADPSLHAATGTWNAVSHPRRAVGLLLRRAAPVTPH